MRCVGSGAVLLKPSVAEITSFNFRHQIIGYHGAITVAIDGYVLTGIIFEEIWTDDSTGPQTTPKRWFSRWNVSSWISLGCSSSQMRQFYLFIYPLSQKWASSTNKIWLENVGSFLEFFKSFFSSCTSYILYTLSLRSRNPMKYSLRTGTFFEKST